MEYYFLFGDQVRGPFGLADCFMLIDQGTLTRDSMICQAGGENWQKLQTLPELNARFARAASKATSQAVYGGSAAGPILVHDKSKASGRSAKVIGFLMIAVGVVLGVFAGGDERVNRGAAALAALLFIAGFVIFIIGRFME